MNLLTPFIALCVFIVSAAAQNTSVNVDSHVPSLTVTLIGQQEGSYRFKVANQSSHAVTAFALRSIPIGTPFVDGQYACDDQCGRSVTVANTARPAIKAGGSVERSFSVSRVGGGTVVAEAAIFDDESYEGDGRAAAFLLAGQIGRQAEYDRLLAAVNTVFAGVGDDVYKATQIRHKLGAVPLTVDAAMVSTFQMWFPALADCTEPYLHFMKRAAAREKSLLVESMEQFAHGTAPGKPTLSQWWSTAEQQLADYGCHGCATRTMKPKSPAGQNVELACHDDTLLVIFTASLDDGGLEMDDADDELSSEEVAIAKTRPPEVRSVSPPSPQTPRATAPVSASRDDVPSVLSPQLPPQPPSGIPLSMTLDGKLWVGARSAFNGPLPDYMLYRTFFRDIKSMGDLALREPVLWPQGQLTEYHGPRAGGLNDDEITVLQQIVAACDQKVSLLWRKRDTLISTKLAGYPMGWMTFAPPLPGLRELQDKEKAAINACIGQLRTRLGPDSFARLEGFVRKIYRASPGKMIAIPLPDDGIYVSFFHYFGELEAVALSNPRAKQELYKRHQELRAAGFSEEEQALLKTIAMNYNQTMRRFEMRGIAISSPAGSQGPSSVIGVRATASAQLPASATFPGVRNPSPLEPPASREDLKRSLSSALDELKAGIGQRKFKGLTGYLRRLYAPATREKAVAIGTHTDKQVSGKIGIPAGLH